MFGLRLAVLTCPRAQFAKANGDFSNKECYLLIMKIQELHIIQVQQPGVIRGKARKDVRSE